MLERPCESRAVGHFSKMENITFNAKVQVEGANLQMIDSFASPSLPKLREVPLRATIASLGKKALFFTSVPFYWLVFFTQVMRWYDTSFFVFVVAASIVLSLMGKNWGILHFLSQ